MILQGRQGQLLYFYKYEVLCFFLKTDLHLTLNKIEKYFFSTQIIEYGFKSFQKKKALIYLCHKILISSSGSSKYDNINFV